VRWGWLFLGLSFLGGVVLGVRSLRTGGGVPEEGVVIVRKAPTVPEEERASPPPAGSETTSSGTEAPRNGTPVKGATGVQEKRGPSPSLSDTGSLRITAPSGFDVGPAGRTDLRDVAADVNGGGKEEGYTPPRIVADVAEQLRKIVEEVDASTLRVTRDVLEEVPFLNLTPEKAELRPSGDGVNLKVVIPADTIALKGKTKPVSSEQVLSKDEKKGK
jgi:hypothetical protein